MPHRWQFPGLGGVAVGTVLTELPAMHVILGMTTNASRGRTGKDVILVTLGTSYLGVFPRQFEPGLAVIKGHLLPILGRVALSTVCAEHQTVNVILDMACDTFLRRASKYPADMALAASNLSVLTGELEGGQVVIKYLRLPSISVVAAGAVSAKVGWVLVILLVTARAVGWGLFETGQSSHSGMAIYTFDLGVLSQQRVVQAVMIELALAEEIGPVVTGPTVRAKLSNMDCYKPVIIAAMAGFTSGRLKASQNFGVAVGTGKGAIINGKLVSIQAEAKLVVINLKAANLCQVALRPAMLDVALAAVLPI